MKAIHAIAVLTLAASATLTPTVDAQAAEVPGWVVSFLCPGGTIGWDGTWSGLWGHCYASSADPGVGPIVAFEFENVMVAAGEDHNTYLDCALQYETRGDREFYTSLVEDCAYPIDVDLDTYIDQQLQQPIAVYGDVSRGARTAGYSSVQSLVLGFVDSALSGQYTSAEAAFQLGAVDVVASTVLGDSAVDLHVLGAISTARSSLEYWTIDTAGPVELAAWWTIVKADVKGFTDALNVHGGPGGCDPVGNAILYSFRAATDYGVVVDPVIPILDPVEATSRF